jgi:signal transduction histidine kinase
MAGGTGREEGQAMDQRPAWRLLLYASTWFDALLGLAVFVVGIIETVNEFQFQLGTPIYLALHCLLPAGMGVAVALHRQRPGTALAVAWLACAFQVLTSQNLIFAEFAIVIVAYGTARYGSVPVLWASVASVPAAYAIALVNPRLFNFNNGDVLELSIVGARWIGEGRLRPGAVVIAAAAVVLALPWLAGFALRMRARAVASQAASAAAQRDRAEAEDQRAQAQQLAEARAEQTRLARDVHDVVGHSLAVILAQAQSGDYLPADDPERLKQALRNIADSARASLQDVRRILTATSGDPRDTGGGARIAGPRDGDLERLLDDVRNAGLDIRETVTGTARPLPPELATAVYRVVQEMLTNSIKHGAPDAPVYVRRDWTDGLTIEVSNLARAGAPDSPSAGDDQGGPAAGAADEREEAGGRGLDGMRQRLAAAGGTLTVSGDLTPGDRPVFTVRAWLPLPGHPQPGPVLPAATGARG